MTRGGTFKKSNFLWSPLTWALVLIILTGVAWLVFRDKTITNELDKEFLKALPQVGLVSVAGALLSFAADRFQRKQERIRLREDFFKDLMKRITASYNKSKSARRMVRAKGLTPPDKPTHVRLEAYDDCMETLNDAQLELEAIKKDLQSSMADLPEDALVHSDVKRMEDYLNQIIREYENVRLAVEKGAEELSLVDTAQFETFAAKKDQTQIDIAPIQSFKDYANLHGAARKAINDRLIELASKN